MSDLSEIRRLVASLPPEVRAGMREAADKGLDALRKPEDLSLPQWAHRHFWLSAESSQREERWRAWPLQIGLLHVMGDDNVQELAFYKSARLGYTKCLLAEILYTAHHQRRNQGLWLPTDADRDDFVKTDLDPALRDVKVMSKVMPKSTATAKESTLQQKSFLGSRLKLRGGKSSGNYRRLTLAKAVADEIDGFEQNVEGAGTPDALIRKRVEGATYPKVIFGSTGRKKGLSHIERLHDACDVQMKFHIACPHCKEEHPLLWGGSDVKHGMKWDMADPEGTVRHVCPHCYESISQADYLDLARSGCWISACGNFRLRHWWDEKGEPQAEWTTGDGTPCLPPKRVGMHCWTAYSEQPGVTWANIVREFLDALKAFKAGNRTPMIQWVNETKGETHEEESEKADVNALESRARKSHYLKCQVPHDCLQLTVSVDVQNDRWEGTVWGIGRGEQTWAIDYWVIEGNPAVLEQWDRVWQAMRTQYRHMNGAWVSPAAGAVDTGHLTHTCYAFVAKYRDADPSFRLYAIKGDSADGAPIKARAAKYVDINFKGRVLKKGVKLWMVGGDTARDLFHGRLKVTQPGPGYVNFAKDLPSEFFAQFGNEKRIPIQTQGRTIFKWIHFRGANEVPDTTMYCLFLFEAALDVSKYSERRWQDLERQVAPDLLSEALDQAPDNAAHANTADDVQLPAPVLTRPQPEKPQPAAQSSKATAPTAPNPFASSDWLGRL